MKNRAYKVYLKPFLFLDSEESQLFQEQMETFKMNSTILDEQNKSLVKENEEQLNMAMKENQDRIRFVNFIKKYILDIMILTSIASLFLNWCEIKISVFTFLKLV